MGEFNLDLLQCNHHVQTQEFIDSLFSHAFFPHVKIHIFVLPCHILYLLTTEYNEHHWLCVSLACDLLIASGVHYIL